MKMHSPGQASAAWITSWTRRTGTHARLPEPPGSLSGYAALGDVGDAVLELHEHVGAVVDAQAVARAQVLIDPHPHAIRRYRHARRVPGSGHPRLSLAAAPKRPTLRPCAAHDRQPRRRQASPTHWHRPTGDVDDPWAWLRDRDDPDTIAYLEAENAYSPTPGSPTTPTLVDELFEEIKSRIQETDESVPGAARSVVVRQPRTVEGRVVPDPLPGRARATRPPTSSSTRTSRPPADDFFDVDAVRPVSPDHNCWRGRADLDGGEMYTLRVRDLAHRRRPARRADRHVVVGRRGVVGRRAATSSTPARRRRCGRTRSGATASAPRSQPTTCWCSRSPTSASTSTSS